MGRVFFRCENCYYIFTTERNLSSEETKAHFKNQWIQKPEGAYPACCTLLHGLLESTGKPCRRALDFGCGNGGLVRSLRERGIETFGIDPIPVENDLAHCVYPRLEDLPEKRFDMITALEVFEHLDRPSDTLSRLISYLSEDGFIFLTTALTNRALTGIRCFPYWIYQKDPTHVGFFDQRTFEWMATRFSLEIHIFHHDFVVLDRSFERLVDIEGDRYVFRPEKHSPLVQKRRSFWNPAGGIDFSKPPEHEIGKRRS
jgi:SAM-dependent methyltransferase